MSRMLLGVLGTASLLAALAGPAVAQEKTDWVWHTDGKRYWRTEEVVKPLVMPPTISVEVAPVEQKEGDVLGFKYVGKRTERVYFREVPRPAPELARHECTWRLHYEGKRTTREHYCVVNGVECACAGFDKSGNCLTPVEKTGPAVK